MDEEDLLNVIDSGSFIDHYINRFEQGLETDKLDIYRFDHIFFAGSEDGEGGIVWGSVRQGEKHMALLFDAAETSDRIQEIRPYLQQLNATPTDQANKAFYMYLTNEFSKPQRLPHNALIEIPDPTAPKVRDYPVVNVILFADPEGQIVKTVEATLRNTGFSVEDPESVMEHVEKYISDRDIRSYADTVYSKTLQQFEEELNADLIPDVHHEDLEAAEYTKLKEDIVPGDLHPIYGESPGTYWQKEIWHVDGIDADTGFARIWLVEDESVGLIAPSQTDIETEEAIQKIKAELETS